MTRKGIDNKNTPLQLSPVSSAVRTALFYGSVIAIASTQATSPAFAQTSSQDERRDNYDLEEIVVTATRRESTIFEVPYAISVLSGKNIERSGVQDLSDLVRVVPGIAYMDQGPRVANNNNYIILRGLNATSQSGAADTPFLAQPVVSTYFGNIPIFSNFQTADLNRVEVQTALAERAVWLASYFWPKVAFVLRSTLRSRKSRIRSAIFSPSSSRAKWPVLRM